LSPWITGRKPLQIIGALVMAVAMLALGSTFALQIKGVLRCSACWLYIADLRFLGTGGLGPLRPKFFQSDRGKAMAVAVAANGSPISWSVGPSPSSTTTLLC